MSVAFVQSVARNQNAAGPQGTAYGTNNVQGNLLVCMLSNTGASASFAVADTQGNVWNAIGSVVQGSARSSQIFYAMNCKAGANTVNITVTGFTSACEVFIAEYSGVALTSALDQATNSPATGTASASPNSGNVTTLQSNELLIGFMFNNTGETITASGNTPNLRQNPNTVHAYADGFVNSAGANSASFGMGGSATWVCFIATFFPASSVGGGSNASWLTVNLANSLRGLRH